MDIDASNASSWEAAYDWSDGELVCHLQHEDLKLTFNFSWSQETQCYRLHSVSEQSKNAGKLIMDERCSYQGYRLHDCLRLALFGQWDGVESSFEGAVECAFSIQSFLLNDGPDLVALSETVFLRAPSYSLPSARVIEVLWLVDLQHKSMKRVKLSYDSSGKIDRWTVGNFNKFNN